MLDDRRLRAFVEVARAGTYLAAAERLHIAQPALWKQVRSLEEELGVRLFERTGRRVRLTAAGSDLLVHAERLLRGAERLRRHAEDLAAGRAGSLTVACVPPHVERILARVIGAFRAAHPDIRVRLQEHGTAAGVREALLSGAADLATASAGLPGLAGFPLYDVAVVALPPPGHRLRRSGALPVERLAGEPLVVPPRGYLSREELERACRVAGFAPTIEAESTSPRALAALAEAGVGIAVVADDALGSEPAARPLAAEPPLGTTVWLYRAPTEPTAAAQAFIAAARAAAARASSQGA